MKLFNNHLFFVLTAVLLLSACKRKDTYWEDDLVAPLASGKLTLANLFPDTTIKTNADSSLKISFESSLINYGLDSLVKIPDTTITTVTTNTFLPTFTMTPNELFPIFVPQENEIAISNVQLKKAIVRSGKIKVELQNTCRQPLVYTYTLSSASVNNTILTRSFYIPGNGDSTYYVDLSGYNIDFTGTNHNKYNTIEQYGQIYTASNAVYDTVFLNQGVISNFTFQSIIPQYVEGYFGNQQINLTNDTANFGAFSSIKKGLLNLNSTTLQLILKNEFGVSMQAHVSNITSINTNNPSTVTLTAIPQINLSPAVNTGFGATATTKTITLNQSNSNVTSFIGNLPNKISYLLNAQVNPPPVGNAGTINFAYYGTSFSTQLKLDVPLYFSASNLLLADTVSLDISGVAQLNNVNRGNIILTATNSYPFSIQLNALLLDANKQPLEELFSSPSLIAAPPLDMNGKVTGSLQSKIYVPLNSQKINNLQKARYVAYSATFNTANQPLQVKFYSNNTLDLLMTADINYTLGK